MKEEIKYRIIDKETKEKVGVLFDTKNEAEIFFEEEGMDYDYYEIIAMQKV